MVALHDLGSRSASVWALLKKDGAVVVTRNGRPEGIVVSTSAERWLEDVQTVLFARARRAVTAMRLQAKAFGASGLSGKEIEKQIAAARRSRKHS